MTKLKTLEDLQKDFEWDFNTYKALRREAIKWVLEFERQNVKEFAGLRSMKDKDWVIHFFNIKESELG